MLYRSILLLILFSVLLPMSISKAEEVRSYTVNYTDTAPVIDGNIEDAEWEAAPFTDSFVVYTNGAEPSYATYGKILWDREHIYIALKCIDPDVWGYMTTRDAYLWYEDVVEIFFDPDGDGKNYPEIHYNARGTVTDAVMSAAYKDDGTRDDTWDIEGMESAVTVQGTLNDTTDTDTSWVCEFSIPMEMFDTIEDTMTFPPDNGDTWRFNLYRYEYYRNHTDPKELTAWNPTGTTGGFHVPELFGKITFQGAPPVHVVRERPPQPITIGIYPNPFNPTTTIEYHLTAAGMAEVTIFNVTGQKVATLVNEPRQAGTHNVVWNAQGEPGHSLSSGIYIVRIISGGQMKTRQMMYVK